MPLIRKFCLKKGFVDIPNERKVHKKPIPRLGGIAIWGATILAFLALVLINSDYPERSGLSGIFIGGSLMFLLGLVDDIYNLTPKFKLVIQIGVALLAFLLGVRIEFLSNPFGEIIMLGVLSLPITVLWIVGITNAINFIDGIDGLAGGVVAISAIALGVVAIYTNQPASALVAILLIGSIMGFLVFNYHPAKIFMGDSGALFSGFILASLSITGVLKSVTVSMLLPILIFSVPLMDISFSVFRRISKGKNPMKADNEHIHHKLLQSGLSQNSTVVVLYFVCAAGGAIVAFSIGAYRLYLILLLLVILLMAIFWRFAKIRSLKELQEVEQN